MHYILSIGLRTKHLPCEDINPMNQPPEPTTEKIVF